MISESQYYQSLFLVKKAFFYLTGVGVAGQLLIDASWENIACTGLAATAFVLAVMVTFSIRNNSIGAALTATVVFLNITANSLAAIWGTMMEGNAIRYSLLLPVETYFHRLVFAFFLILAQLWANSASSLLFRNLISRLGDRLKTNTLLPPKALWIFAGIGLVGFAAKFLHLPTVVVKLLDAFLFLLWAPFLLLLPPYSKMRQSQYAKRFIGGYYLLMMIMSLAINSRMGMVGPIALLAAAWIVTLLMGLAIVTRKLLRQSIIVILVLIPLAGIFSDLSTAILIERANRGNRSIDDQMAATFDRFWDKKALDEYRLKNLDIAQGVSPDQEWLENYIRNPFIARFVQIKFDDNCLHRISTYAPASFEKLQSITLDKAYALLPDPILKFFSINIDKKTLNSYSIGDLIEVLSGRGFFGGFRTGSIPAHAFALFGFWYPLVLLLIYFILFCIYQGLVSKVIRGQPVKWYISTLGMLIAFDLFTDMSLDGINNLFSILLRNVWQMALIYFVAYKVVQRLLRV